MCHYNTGRIALVFTLLLCLGGAPAYAFGDATHKNLPEDALLYMEFSGSNQQRWVADYLKAKAEGRYTGTCVNINYPEGQMASDNTQCGAHGIMRVAGVKPDYFRESFWDDLATFSWGPPQISMLAGQNYSAWYHFINLATRNVDGNAIYTSNYNAFDGYGANGTYSALELGYDWIITTWMNNATMSVNLTDCTDATCAEKSSVAVGVNTNPATDYRQNGSTTPVSGGSGTKRTESQDGTNYNCFSDTALIGACPDAGSGDSGGLLQNPNTSPGGGGYDPIALLTGNQDWVIFEPSYNVAAFYYNELWLEGLASRNTSLQTAPIVGRYYSVSGPELLYYGVVHHYMADATQQTHVWVTQAYNHPDYESFVSDNYGKRLIGGGAGENWENYAEARAYANGKQHHYRGDPGNIHKLILEQAFHTYHIRLRSGFDKMTTTNSGIWRNAGAWAVNNSIAALALTNEKAVLDLRKCRNSAACNEY